MTAVKKELFDSGIPYLRSIAEPETLRLRSMCCLLYRFLVSLSQDFPRVVGIKPLVKKQVLQVILKDLITQCVKEYLG